MDSLNSISKPPFSDAIVEFEKLMSQPNRVFMLGAGCSKCAGLPLTKELSDEVLKRMGKDSKSTEILEEIKKQFDGAGSPTIEDYMSEIVDLLAIASRRRGTGATKTSIGVNGELYTIDELRQALEEIKKYIAEALDAKELDITTHRQFTQAVHRPLRVGKNSTARPVDYIVLNYDTLIEDALALERVPYCDGFSGGSTGWWEEQKYVTPDMDARVLKVHGSIDWCLLDDENRLPRRLRASNGSYKITPTEKVLIWPASTKYVETQRDPFAKIIETMRRSLRSQAGTQIVLTICGYRFADAHINLEIDNALRESDQRLTVLVFTEDETLQGQLKLWNEDALTRDQVRIFSKKGLFHSDVKITSDEELPWWKFENLTRILRGER